MPSPLLPVLPKRAPRRQYQRLLHPQLLSSQTRTPKAARQAPCPFRHAGLIALCLSGGALISALVTFSIVRDMEALSRPEPGIAAPLHP